MAMLNPLPLDVATHSVKVHTLERRSNLSFSEFAANYLNPHRPVILTDTTAGWRALSRWNADFFSREFADRPVVMAKEKKFFKSTMKEFIEYAKTFAEVHTGKRVENRPYYLRNVIVGKVFPELLQDFSIHEFFTPNWLERWPLKKLFPLAESSSSELFVGPPGASVPVIHRDRFMTHSWLSQVSGEKAFWAVSPKENAFMYQNPANPDHSMVNSMVEPDLRKYPLFAQAKVFGGVLYPGDTVFIPAGWWHTAECLNLSISLSGNFVNESNYAVFSGITTLPAFEGGSGMKKTLNDAVLRAHGAAYALRDKTFFKPGAVRRT